MKRLYSILTNTLVFFFISAVFDSILGIGVDDTIVNKSIIAFLFGLLVSLVPNILMFFKIQVNIASQFLVAFFISFLFFFLSIYIFEFLIVNPSILDIGIDLFSQVELTDRTVGLIFLSIISSLTAVLIKELEERK